MKKLLPLLLFSFPIYSLHAQIFIQKYQDRANQVSQESLITSLQDFEQFGIKKTGSENSVKTLNWLKDKYISYGYSPDQMEEDPFIVDGVHSKNLIITKRGTAYPTTYIVVCAHYDTVGGAGVNDNGSGTSIILEAAKILKDIPTEYSIKFIHFSGEEQGLDGSFHYANTVAFNNDTKILDIKLVLNIDQVGGKKGNINDTLICEKDMNDLYENNSASESITKQLAVCTTLYSPLKAKISEAYSSDYIPFEEKGYVITGLYEYPKSHHEHSQKDNFNNIDPEYVFNVGKVTVGAIQHFAKAAK
ncbi:Zn-dependent exopeptidase M28 [Chryseobacterium sp. G0186]|uniref:M28 family metallopeptidase n=1 Tax=Chryseobacterium sp. G0186 TaxID=2487064 RepID=UPI000F50D2BC|nr:M28 family peptidase [Chryseobacterium sp. G0186]AZA80130.1 Zn-dependent exopeptidase M28 [Chryseobacterium sp. G0186]